MKTLSLVECTELKFTGRILKEAICFGDVDNDNLSELVVGNTDGELFVYKDEKCIARAYDLGCISAIAIGDFLNVTKNVAVVITAEGFCHIFDIERELKMPAQYYNCSGSNTNPKAAAPSSLKVVGSGTGHSVSSHGASVVASAENVKSANSNVRMIQQFHTQRIVANTKAVFLADVNDDGCLELVCGLTDRVLRSYKWNPDPVLECEGQPSLLPPYSVHDGRVQAVNKWELTNQIGSIAPHIQGNLVNILIGTGGGTVTKIVESSRYDLESKFLCETDTNVGSVGCRLERDESVEKDRVGELGHVVQEHSDNIVIRKYALNSFRVRNSNISTHVAGNIVSHDGRCMDSYAVGTWDGTVMICKDDTIEWNLQLNKPVMTVQSFEGKAIFVDMEGPTYLINPRLDRQMQNCVVRFHFEDQIASFRVGWYGLRNEQSANGDLINRKCFAYVTFHESIYVYSNPCL